ncbi:hypothetical protein O6H91_01G115100 [Diphasiastrum complanatum]|uniref:Uncharacterized protein n=1 Tax=Diphasiastrum complanatum TaxID=34168 RepID=A0ACC2EV79_DIPCM|nr:hypothetical protein O6H91_01G115100 [Diphasiastrum complanatum]
MFSITPRFRAAMSLANHVPPERFNAFLGRIIKQLIQDKRPFTEAEELKLIEVLNFNLEDLHSLIDACSLTFERAAAISAHMTQVIELLDSAGVAPSQLAGFQDVWKENASALISAYKEKPFGAPGSSYLLDVQWHLHLQGENTCASQPVFCN